MGGRAIEKQCAVIFLSVHTNRHLPHCPSLSAEIWLVILSPLLFCSGTLG